MMAYTQHFTIAKDEAVFSGHFPQSPVFPGVLLMGMTRKVIESCLKSPSTLKQISRHRFSGMVKPGDELTIAIKLAKDEGKVVTITSVASVGDKTVAKGKFIYEMIEAA